MKALVERRRILLGMAALAVSTLTVAACGDSSSDASSGGSASSESTEVNLVGFSVIKSAYDSLEESFAETPGGEGVEFKASYGASGAQSRAVIAGQKADLVALSLEPDVQNIVEAGKIDPSWNSGPTKGIVSSSVVVLAVRKGNPKNIHGWADIIKPGIGIVAPDPGTSGGAKWNLLAAYSQAAGPDAKNEAAGTQYLDSFINNVVSWSDSARAAADVFVKGTGDVLVSYENEAIAARAAGEELEYIVPDATFLIENPAAVTTTAPPVAKEFLTYISSPEGQATFGSKGFRPVGGAPAPSAVEGAIDPAHPFPAIKQLTTIADLGGWTVVNDKFFDKETGLVTTLRK